MDSPDMGRTKVDGHVRVANGPHREVLATHLPNHDGTSCATCAFVYTKKQPLCPSVADALRELSSSNSRSRAQNPHLASYTTSDLRALARQHAGEGRCQRCGFVYSGRVQSCPTSRRVMAELEVRGRAHVTQPRAGQGEARGRDADAEQHWPRVDVAACSLCPLLAQCSADLDARLVAGEKISAQIQAGRLFTTEGEEIAHKNIDAFANYRGKAKKKQQRQRPAPVPAIGSQLALFPGVAA
ncbi:MAG TPA: hypothetical protein EYQ83_10480 [Acidobacteria bacterium]|nr:hypothetical protein [Acidobacteriota bacterium]